MICGVLSIIPLFHSEFLLDSKYLDDFIIWPWGIGGALYIGGAVMYMKRVPERIWPGHFDICVRDSLLFYILL